MPPAPEPSNGAFSSSASVLLDPDFMDSFPTQVDNADTSNVSMDMDIHDSRYISNNDNGQSVILVMIIMD